MPSTVPFETMIAEISGKQLIGKYPLRVIGESAGGPTGAPTQSVSSNPSPAYDDYAEDEVDFTEGI